MVNGAEICEDGLGWTDPRGCVDFGFDAGPMACALCGPSFAGCMGIGGALEYMTSDAGFNKIHGRARDDVWAVNGGPGAFHFDGNTWSVKAPPNGRFVDGIWVEP